MTALRFVAIALCLPLAHFSPPDKCTIELQCSECVPENMPLVAGAAWAEGGAGSVPEGGALALSCGAGSFRAFPARRRLAAACRAGRLRLAHDGSTRHLLELGCQQSVFEDVLHQVDDCAPPLQGRSYQVRLSAETVERAASVCYDADEGVAAHAHVANYAGRAGRAPGPPPSLLGNLNEMLDAGARRRAERLFADGGALTRRLRELLKYEDFPLGEHELEAAPLLAPRYFAPERRPLAAAASNLVAAWRDVARGNLALLQRDVAELLRAEGAAPLDVFAGTHGRAAPAGAPLRLAGDRFPLPRYIWTAVLTRDRARGLALVVLNEPLVAVSEVGAAVFCDGACGSASWLRRLRRRRAYERPARGLVFCCALPAFAAAVPEMPRVFNDTVAPLY